MFSFHGQFCFRGFVPTAEPVEETSHYFPRPCALLELIKCLLERKESQQHGWPARGLDMAYPEFANLIHSSRKRREVEKKLAACGTLLTEAASGGPWC
jgi:hypothetical protein